MASLTAKIINGQTYYYARECQRVNGKPKIVRTIYLGSAKDLIAAALEKKQAQVPQAHAVAMGHNLIDTFSVRLKELREEKGMSRDALAVQAGTSSHRIAKLEQGVRAPSLELAWRLAQALGCSVDNLVRPASGQAEQPAEAAPVEKAKRTRTKKGK